MTEVPYWLVVAGYAATVLLTFVGLWKASRPVRRRLGVLGERANRALDVVLGTPAVPDPDRPGEVLRAAQPDIGVRMTRTESMLQEFVVGAVAEAKQAAKAAAESASAAQGAAEAARGYAAASAGHFSELGGQVEELAAQVTEWQNSDRYKAEAAQAVLREVVRTIPESARPRGVG